MPKLKKDEFYCLKLRKVVKGKNGRDMLVAICPKTGTKLSKFIKSSDAPKKTRRKRKSPKRKRKSPKRRR